MPLLRSHPAMICITDGRLRSLLPVYTGLGRKSVACVLLLALRKKDFPVDVNVARICARLGWIPLDSEEAIEVGLPSASTLRLASSK